VRLNRTSPAKADEYKGRQILGSIRTQAGCIEVLTGSVQADHRLTWRQREKISCETRSIGRSGVRTAGSYASVESAIVDALHRNVR
jgi:hypothetical protein